MNGASLAFRSVHCLAAYNGPPSLIIIPGIFILTFVVLANIWRVSRARAVLEGWATKNGFQIVRRETRLAFRGPFAWSTSRGQKVFFVTVRDKDGIERSGWVRCGGWFTGLWSDAAEVRWVDLSNVGLDEDNWFQSLPKVWLYVIVLIMVALAALLFILFPKPPVVQI